LACACGRFDPIHRKTVGLRRGTKDEAEMNVDEDQGFEGEKDDAAPDSGEFDQSMLDMLNEDLGPETFAFLLGQCVDDVRLRLEKLSSLPSLTADPAVVRFLAHQLKGVFLQFGANAASQDAAALEAADSDNVDERLAGERLSRLQASAKRALDHFERLRGPA
jgi:hypothetical protein